MPIANAAWAVPFAFLAGAWAFATYHTDPTSAAEASFLGLLATVVLSAIAALDHPPYRVLSVSALLTILAIWTLPPGAAQGATVSVLLVAGTAFATRGRMIQKSGNSLVGSAVALAIAAQALFRPEIWLAPALVKSFALDAVALPVVAGLATASLVSWRGERVLIGVAVAIALSRGISADLTVILAALATVSAILMRRSATTWTATLVVLVAATYPEFLHLSDSPASPRRILTGLSWLLLLVPALLRPASGRRAQTLVAWGLASAGLWLLPTATALILPVVIAFDALPGLSFAWRLQRVWSLAVLLGAVAASAYPWLRAEPVSSTLGMIGLRPGWLGAVIIGIVFWSLVAAHGMSRKTPIADRSAGRSLAPAAFVLFGAVLLTVFPPFRAALQEPIVVSQATPAREITARMRIGEIFVDSYLSNGFLVEPGTSLATVALETLGGGGFEFKLTSGTDTGEWAANRPDLSVEVPPAWISWLAPDGPYFAQRYRTWRTLDSPLDVIRLRIVRADGLPAELEVAVVQIGARR
ncbi:MAG: hypothetical protein ACE5GX_07305 [Thermoanaerobaculia bacterium]